MRIVSLRARAWTLPLRAPFVIAQRTAHEAQNVLVSVAAEAGLTGWGESAPVGYVTGESVASVLAAIEAVGERFRGQPIDRLGPLWERAGRLLSDAPTARAGLEMALADVWARHWSLPLWQFFGGSRGTLTTDLTIPIVAPDEAGTLAAEAWAEGFRDLKIKVGGDAGHEADGERVAAIMEAAPQARLRIDANQAFTPDGAVAFAQSLARLGAPIDLIEQPVAKEDVAGLKYVRERVNVPLFADEAARDVPSVLRLLQEDAVDGVNIKLMKSGLAGAIQSIALCRAAGKKLMLGCMLESGLGIAAAAQIAGGTGAFDFLDLDSHRLLAPLAGVSGGFRADGGTLHVGGGDGPGWGVTTSERQAEIVADAGNKRNVLFD